MVYKAKNLRLNLILWKCPHIIEGIFMEPFFDIQLDIIDYSWCFIFQEALDNLIHKIDLAKEKWEEKATLVQVNNKHLLMEFGLNPLEL